MEKNIDFNSELESIERDKKVLDTHRGLPK